MEDTRVDPALHEVENLFGEKYPLKDVKPEDWRAAFCEELYHIQGVFHNLCENPNAVRTDDLDQAADLFDKAVQNATARVGKPHRPSLKAKPWWNAGLTDAADRLNDLKKQLKDEERRVGVRSRHIRFLVIRAQNYLRRRVKHAKTAWVTEVTENAGLEESFALRKWSTGARNHPTPAIKRSDGFIATTSEDKREALRAELFQAPPPLSKTISTEAEIDEAIRDASSELAPGAS
ncbi:hypothetical protein K525DRAFT_274974 [Schizophyllum commune Loenen D]|nr:hypothetical protein K525DRAFT_274974 [Schizophyllum commune Loenen D]